MILKFYRLARVDETTRLLAKRPILTPRNLNSPSIQTTSTITSPSRNTPKEYTLSELWLQFLRSNHTTQKKNPIRSQFKLLIKPTAIKVITTIPTMTVVGANPG